MIPEVLRNFSCFIDGRGMAGKCTEVQPPKVTVKTEEFRGGGMEGPIDVDMGLEKMEAMFTLSSFEPEVLALWGVSSGSPIAAEFRGAFQSETGAVRAAIINVRGTLTELDPGSWKAGDNAELKGKISVRAYKCTVDGQVAHDIDMVAGTRIINGVDQSQAIREALGL